MGCLVMMGIRHVRKQQKFPRIFSTLPNVFTFMDLFFTEWFFFKHIVANTIFVLLLLSKNTKSVTSCELQHRLIK